MIGELVELYEKLCTLGQIPEYGWSTENVPYGLEIDDEGNLLHIVRLGDTSQKKPKNSMEVPAHYKRSSGIKANFLCDNAAYLLAAAKDNDREKNKAEKRYLASKNIHLKILENADSPAAHAIRSFFRRPPQTQKAKELFGEDWDKIVLSNSSSSPNLIFCYKNASTGSIDPSLRDAWNGYFRSSSVQDSLVMQSLVSGEKVVPESIHPAIKGIFGAQSSGAALISFNASAFNSYGHKQNQNAPLSKYEAFAYTTALNRLIEDRVHTVRIEDTTIVSWSKHAETACQDIFTQIFKSDSAALGLSDSEVHSYIKQLSHGEQITVDGSKISPEEPFYVLGIAPNAARLSVRFFYENSFGAFARNVNKHYFDLNITKPQWAKNEDLPLWRLVKQTVNTHMKQSTTANQLTGALLRAILTGCPYPYTLISNLELRLRAGDDLTWEKASIIKAYYLRTNNPNCPKEVLTVSLNEESQNVPYVLGRLFSVYEAIQEAASSTTLNVTVRDRFFNSAAATPARVFPTLGSLHMKHLRKLERGKQIYFEKQVQDLMGRLGTELPPQLTLPEQASFQLGYYQQTQKRYEKTASTINNDNKED